MTNQRKIRSAKRAGPTGPSTAVLVIGSLLLLALGFLAGWFARPTAGGTDGDDAAGVGVATPATTQENPGMEATRTALMANLTAQARHFKGAENAPVTILEFSDFQ